MGLHIGALYFGPTQEVLRLEPIGMRAWGKILATSITILIVVELHKWIRRRSAAELSARAPKARAGSQRRRGVPR